MSTSAPGSTKTRRSKPPEASLPNRRRTNVSPFPETASSPPRVHEHVSKENAMTLTSIGPPDVELIETDPLAFRARLQAYVDAMTAAQSRAGDLERVNEELRTALDQKKQHVQE